MATVKATVAATLDAVTGTAMAAATVVNTVNTTVNIAGLYASKWERDAKRSIAMADDTSKAEAIVARRELIREVAIREIDLENWIAANPEMSARMEAIEKRIAGQA